MEYKNKNNSLYFAITFYIIIYYMFIIFFRTEKQLFNTIQILFETIPKIIVFIVLLNLSLKKDKKSIFLNSILIIMLANLVEQCFEIYYKIFLKADLGKYLAIDIVLMVPSITFFIVLIYKFYKKRDSGSTLVLAIDIFTIMCVTIALTWMYNISQQISYLPEINLVKTIIYMSYPTLHLGILSVAIILHKSMNYKDPEKKSIFTVIIASLVIYVAKLVYTYLLSKNAYNSINIIEPLWTIYEFLLMIAAIQYLQSSDVKWKRDSSYKSKIETRGVLPLISTISLFILVTIKHDRIVWICFGVSVLLINIRQLIINSQKKSLILQLGELNKSLEEKVEERTKEIYEIASSDHLTGLVNRRRFELVTKEMMEESKRNNTKVSLILLDLDRFKVINDNYGHSFGDLLIKEFANIIVKVVDANSVVSRQGGDEFAIATKGVKNEKYAKDVAEKIIKKLISPIVLDKQRVYTTCSIGISIYPKDGETYEDIIRCADLAMYHSKELGRNTYSFYEENMIKLNSKRLTFERELHKAIEKNEFILHYQPQIDIEKQEIMGFEALIRWNHPTQGLISPFQFISIAEETGLIGVIGEWVLETACKQMKKWHEKGFGKVKIGVNISPYQFQQENFVDMVRNILIKSRLNPKYLDLEITESIAMKNEIQVITKLKKLKRLGVQVSMDDFGTGYSSLSYLRRLPIDTLKIPREFIMEIKPYEDRKNIIEAIIAIAQKLDLEIIAEGVENDVQLDFLKNRNCNFIQGYLFSKPLPKDEAEAFLNKKL